MRILVMFSHFKPWHSTQLALFKWLADNPSMRSHYNDIIVIACLYQVSMRALTGGAFHQLTFAQENYGVAPQAKGS